MRWWGAADATVSRLMGRQYIYKTDAPKPARAGSRCRRLGKTDKMDRSAPLFVAQPRESTKEASALE